MVSGIPQGPRLSRRETLGPRREESSAQMAIENPWKTLGSREIYQNPWLRLREDEVIHPNGERGIYGVVETHAATGVCALTPDLEVVLVGQYRYPTESYSWEIVEGGAQPGERPLEAIQRELKEEAGLVARKWGPLAEEIQLSNCISAELGYIYWAEDLMETEACPDDTEILDVKRVPLTKCLQMIESGEITDAVSIMGLLLLERRLRTENREGWGG